MAGKLKVVFLLRNESVVEVAEVETLVSAHLDYHGDQDGHFYHDDDRDDNDDLDADDDDNEHYGNDLEHGGGQLHPVQSESLVPLVGLERHKPHLHSHHDGDDDDDKYDDAEDDDEDVDDNY